MLVVSHLPKTASRIIAWLEKGFGYDTGRLSLKSRTNLVRKDFEWRNCGIISACCQISMYLVQSFIRD
jgi:hypothetical protein